MENSRFASLEMGVGSSPVPHPKRNDEDVPGLNIKGNRSRLESSHEKGSSPPHSPTHSLNTSTESSPDSMALRDEKNEKLLGTLNEGGFGFKKGVLLPPGSEMNYKAPPNLVDDDDDDDDDDIVNAMDDSEHGHLASDPTLQPFTKLKMSVMSRLSAKVTEITGEEFGGRGLGSDSDQEENSSDAEELDEDEDVNIKINLSTRKIKNTTVLGYMLTIRTSALVYRDVVLDSAVIPAVCSRKLIYYILPIGDASATQVEDFAGAVFERIRRHSGIRTDDLLNSWCDSDIEGPMESSGKSNSFFIFSKDKRFIVKSLNRLEAKWLISILPDYVDHLEKYPSSLLLRYLGLYKLTQGKSVTYFTVLPNLLYHEPDLQTGPMEVYDLKGSVVARTRKETASKNAPYLDNDFKRKIHLGSKRKKTVLEQLKKDSEFLASKRFMDYSLLVGICTRQSVASQNSTEQQGIDSHLSSLLQKSSSKVPSMVYFVRTGIEDMEPPVIFEPRVDAPPPPFSCLKRTRRKKLSQARINVLKSSDPDGYESDYNAVAFFGRQDLTLSMTDLSMPDMPEIDDGVCAQSQSGFKYVRQEEESVQNPHTFKSMKNHEPKEMYFMGIIDVLQKYNKKKKLAKFAKSFKHDKNRISTAGPNFYAKRFNEYAQTILE